jgi:hypothetical protein
LASDDVEVMDHCDPAEVEQVLARTQVAGAVALPAADMGQGVFDLGALAEPGAALRGLLAGSQLDQQPLVGVELHAAAAGAGALGTQRTRLAGLGGELDLAARGERHGHLVGADQQLLVEVEGERGLGEPWPVADRERLAEDLQVGVAVADQAARQLRPIDVELAKRGLLSVQVRGDLVGDLGLWEIRGGHPDGTDQLGVQVTEHMALVAVDALAAGLAAMAHLWVGD